MAGGTDGNPRCKVEKAIAVDVPYVTARGAFYYQGVSRGGRGGDIAGASLEKGPATRTRRNRSDLHCRHAARLPSSHIITVLREAVEGKFWTRLKRLFGRTKRLFL